MAEPQKIAARIAAEEALRDQLRNLEETISDLVISPNLSREATFETNYLSKSVPKIRSRMVSDRHWVRLYKWLHGKNEMFVI